MQSIMNLIWVQFSVAVNFPNTPLELVNIEPRETESFTFRIPN